MTLTEISEKIRDHLTQQKARSMIGSICGYRGDDGKMCAVGCLIKDEHYKMTLENLGSRDEKVHNAVEQSLGFPVTQEITKLLGDWQYYHDRTDYEFWASGSGTLSPAVYHDKLMGKLQSV
jgi:hypothetical protein